MRFKTRFVGRGLLGLVAVAVLAGMVMLLWNAVIPAAFAGGRPIDYLHALGLLMLSRILFGGFRGYGGWRGHQHWWRWQAMTPEEREQIQTRMRSGGHPWGRE